MRLRSPCIVASLITLIAPIRAEAQESSDARAAFEQGHAAYEEGRFADAVAHFERCFALTEEPDVLYNLANAYDRLRRDADALEAYRRFLALRPDTTDRAQIEGRIAVLAQAQAQVAPPPPPTEVPAPSEPPLVPIEPAIEVAAAAAGPDLGGWSLVGAGAAALIASVVLLALAQADLDAVASGTRWAEVQGPYERAPVISGAGFGALGLGVALGAGGVVWLAVGGAL